MEKRNRWSCVVSLLIFSVVVQIPFLQKAFHIDDNIYLMVAENLYTHSWFPQDLHTYFEGLRVESFISHEHPLLLSSVLLAPATAVSVRPELTAHVTYLIFFLLLVLSIFLLCESSEIGWMAAALTAVSPVVFVSSHSLMSDLPYVALVYVALVLVVVSNRGFPGSTRSWMLLCAGLSCAAAAMFAYQAVFFVPVVYWAACGGLAHNVRIRLRFAAFWTRYVASKSDAARRVSTPENVQTRKARVASEPRPDMTRRDHRAGQIWIWALPLTILFAYAAINSVYFGRFIWWDLFVFWHQQPVSAGGLWAKLTYSLLTLLGAITFPLAWVVLLSRKTVESGPPAPPDRTNALLIALVVVTFFMILFVYHIGTARYLLPAAPAICIFMVSRMRAVVRHLARRIAWFAALFGLTAGVSFSLASADSEWAAFYRDAASVVSEYQHQGTKVWIAGEWGFRWYFRREGGIVLGRADNRPLRGDILIRPKLASPYLTAYDRFPNALELEKVIQYRPSLPVRLLDFDSHAGFYSSGWGLLPYSVNLSDKALEEILIYRVKKPVPAPAREPTYWDWNKPNSE
ncbi:MAG TPA: hypothetical protein VGK99_20100 [Acidobacteriota bacterium]|jgi:hypothetical protein